MVAVETVLSLVGAALTGAGTAGGVALRLKNSRESKFYERYDRRMIDLENKVAECEAERPVISILKLGICMLAPEVQRLSRRLGDYENPVILQVINAFEALPQEKDETMAKLILQLRKEPGVYSPAEGVEQNA